MLQNGIASNEVKYPPNCTTRIGNGDLADNKSEAEAKAKLLDKLYEPKQNKKMFRIMTVIVYMFCVSMIAILLSLYYLFLWDPYLKYHKQQVKQRQEQQQQQLQMPMMTTPELLSTTTLPSTTLEQPLALRLVVQRDKSKPRVMRVRTVTSTRHLKTKMGQNLKEPDRFFSSYAQKKRIKQQIKRKQQRHVN